ncbi:(p)pGpp hydrolase [Orientia tsutsugamushi]|uniref:(P)pGpp hydrolase n=1 Tax=Orientia tsutsugamushi TaxID=784 RepID=A0A2U3REY0_ORITS|nr:(p)pGpp hydrolase [Orientia tsutsugamushi]
MIDFYSESLLNKLFETNVRFNTEIDLDKVEKAIFYAKKYHGQQKRDTGEPYYMHPLEVACMVGASRKGELILLVKDQLWKEKLDPPYSESCAAEGNDSSKA